jgi:hypothetical protein
VRALAISAVLAATPAAADPREAMNDYFDGEITGGWTLAGMGVAGLATSGVLIADDGPRARGASYVTIGFGAAHLVAGVYVNIASRVRKQANGLALAKAQGPWLAYERKRMRGVSTQFLVLKLVEVALIAGGGTMAVLGNNNDSPRLEGAGYALAAEAAATLVFDIFAARRAHRYRAQLANASGQPVVIVGAQISF